MHGTLQSEYHKDTNSSMLQCTEHYKSNTTKTLIHRYYKISSDISFFYRSISTLNQMFIINDYGYYDINRIYNKFTNSLNRSNTHTSDSTFGTHTTNPCNSPNVGIDRGQGKTSN